MAQVVTERISGWATDIVHFPVAPSEPTRALLLLVPGNPGVIDFYTSFLEQIHARSSCLEVLGVGHAGHTLRTAVDGVPFTLEQQVQHKLDVLAHRFEGSGAAGLPPLVLAGHSIGAWICLRLAERVRSPPAALAGARVLRVVGLCPTIMKMALSPNGRLLTPLLSRPAVRGAAGALAALLSRLPGALHRAVASLALQGRVGEGSGVGGCAVDASLQLVDRRCLASVLAMAAQEMREVDGIESLAPTMRRLGSRLELIFSSQDGWVPLSYVEELRRLLPRAVIDVEEDPRVEHAFTLSRFTSGFVAGKVVDSLREPLLLGESAAQEKEEEVEGGVLPPPGRVYSADAWVMRHKEEPPRSRL